MAKVLKGWNLVMKPHDPYSQNSQVDGKQLTLIFHIDDTLLAHDKDKIVKECIKMLDGVRRSASPLTSTRGKHHGHLGMTLNLAAIKQAYVNEKNMFQP